MREQKKHMFRGELKTPREIAAVLGITRRAVESRIAMGIPVDQPLHHGKGRKRTVTEFRGQLRTDQEIADMLGLSRYAVAMRRVKGLPLDTPRQQYRGGPNVKVYVEFRGRSCTLREVSQMTGIHINTIRKRYEIGTQLDAPMYGEPKRKSVVDVPYVDRDTPFEEDEACQQLIREHPNGMRLEQIGEALRCSRERVRQLEAQAIRKLRRAGFNVRELAKMKDDADELERLRKPHPWSNLTVSGPSVWACNAAPSARRRSA